MDYIALTGYFPEKHQVFIRADVILAITKNLINPNSRGSVVYCDGAELMVLEEPDAVLKMIEDAYS